MTEEKLKKGEHLLELINLLEREKKRWNAAQYLCRVTLRTEIKGRSDAVDIISGYIDFDSLKVLTLANIEKCLAEAQKEFNEL